MSDLRILVISDDPLARAGIAALLDGQSGYLVVGLTAVEADLSPALAAHLPDVLVWDLGWEPAISLEYLADLGEPMPPVVLLLPDESYAAEAWAAGGRGLILRDSQAEQILAAVTAVSHTLAVIDPSLMAALLPTSSWPSATPIEPLTPREQEVLQLLAEGITNKAIAQRLNISDHTVKFHVNAILSKLDVQSRTEAVIRATKSGMILL